MLFSSLIFLFAFLPIVLAIYFLLKLLRLPLKVRNRFLLLASLFFYGWGEPIYLFLMIGCILANYGFGLLVSKFRENPESRLYYRLSITGMLVVNLAILGIFKYTDFVISNINALTGSSIPLQEIVLPIGISFFIFQGISYVLDVAWGRGEVQKNPLDVGLYISLFPQLIAGPIVRYNTVAAEIRNRRETISDFAAGTQIFIAGLAKKVLLANNFAIVADKIFAIAPDRISVSMAWLGAIAYTLQIYFDFGGYSDMAIGLGRMFGFHFQPNFNFPYISRSVGEFWRRWHISLGTWFRDYVYFPLGGSRVNSKLKLFRNLLVVWGLTGLWHGANWTFVVWGLYYFCFLAFEKFTHLDKKLERIPVLSTILVMFITVIGWVFFRSDNLGYAVGYIGAMFNGNGLGFWNSTGQFYFDENKLLFLIGIICALPFNRVLHNWLARKQLVQERTTKKRLLRDRTEKRRLMLARAEQNQRIESWLRQRRQAAADRQPDGWAAKWHELLLKLVESRPLQFLAAKWRAFRQWQLNRRSFAEWSAENRILSTITAKWHSLKAKAAANETLCRLAEKWRNCRRAAARQGIGLPFLLDVLKIIILMLLLTASVSYLAKGSYNPFIYFNF